MQDSRFTALPLRAELLTSVAELGYETMTPVQAACLPSVLDHRDLLVQAKTGSGKTAVFGLGILHHLDRTVSHVQALVLCPTRELADQVSHEIRRLAKHIPHVKVLTLCGGRPVKPQAASLEHGAHILVGTPGRIEDHLARGTFDPGSLTQLVLDEADRMLDMGFQDSIRAIINQMPKKRQTLLFSATYPDTIQSMASNILQNPLEVRLESLHGAEDIQQVCYEIRTETDRLAGLEAMLHRYQPQSGIVFCTTKEQCKTIAKHLQDSKYKALALHGDLEQREREVVMALFANKSCKLLVATDVAARGLHIDSVEVVINYQLPRTPEIYIHRIGRTGRAGKTGYALNLCLPSEKWKLSDISAYQKCKFSFERFETPLEEPAAPLIAAMATIEVAAGKKNKVSRGDILGALTNKECGILGRQVGKIAIFDFHSYVAVEESVIQRALSILEEGKIKGRCYKVRRIF
jgi:ATP-independent RNA helicase DbpA